MNAYGNNPASFGFVGIYHETNDTNLMVTVHNHVWNSLWLIFAQFDGVYDVLSEFLFNRTDKISYQNRDQQHIGIRMQNHR